MEGAVPSTAEPVRLHQKLQSQIKFYKIRLISTELELQLVKPVHWRSQQISLIDRSR
jgi:hypothetical protein